MTGECLRMDADDHARLLRAAGRWQLPPRMPPNAKAPVAMIGNRGSEQRWRWDLNPRRLAPHTLSRSATVCPARLSEVRPRRSGPYSDALRTPANSGEQCRTNGN
ncbi:hypothetical protein GCM10022267_04590 [Lentzea roselyniae]|uniref:Uncharacterized protein n=1 Tax=Lentzea roselyniae TaxID=531940 RepID=A0ABP6ZZU4_9PSEU